MFKSASSWLGYLGLLLGAGYAAWLFAPQPPAIRVVSATAEAWQLPSPVEMKPGRAIEILAISGGNLWGKLPDIEQVKPMTPPDWRIIASVSRGAMAFVIIKYEDTQQEQRIKVGEALPGGARILKVETGKVCILLNGKERKLVF